MKVKKIYICNSCGIEADKWSARCSQCGEFGTMDEFHREVTNANKKLLTNIKRESQNISSRITKLIDVEVEQSNRIVTNLKEFNRVMGGGIVKDSVSIITAKPGAGKSTLLLQVAQDIATQGYKVLYASGEESDSQIKARAERILERISDNIWISSDTSMDNIVDILSVVDPDLIIIDSIQTFTLEEQLPSRAGSPSQTMECANTMVKIAKNKSRKRAVIFVGQMNKNEEMAGLRALEHLVDTVLVIDGDADDDFRELQSTKNRFGSTGEMGFFLMTEKGLESIDNPSEFFMTIRDKKDEVSGSSLTVVREGTRPVILEIESLVSNSFMPYPSRISEGLRKDQLNILISILEQRSKFNLINKNVVIKIAGGLKVKENAINLSIMMSIASSFIEKAIPNDYAFISDVGLTGELKKVPSIEQRIRELDRMGFKKAYVAEGSISKKINLSGLKIIQKKTIGEVISDVFGKIYKSTREN